jgi:uncharacterized protein YdiU (UPF0061 family)
LRVGTFQFFAARGETDKLRQLADYAIARHDPDLSGTPERYLRLLERVTQRQARLIAQWMNVGFIHGVMNTDNMTLSGETIDYGPCAFMEAYDPKAVFSSIDQGGRYAYGNQPLIAQWNLARLAEALLPLVVEDAGGGDVDAAADKAIADATGVLESFKPLYAAALLEGQRSKLGIAPGGADEGQDADALLAQDWLGMLHAQSVDFTLAWRRLADAADGNDGALLGLFKDTEPVRGWLQRWRTRCERDGQADQARAEGMRRASPWIIPRNHQVEEALKAASEAGDLGPFERLMEAIRSPYDERPGHAAYAEPAPAEVTACYRTFCGT